MKTLANLLSRSIEQRVVYHSAKFLHSSLTPDIGRQSWSKNEAEKNLSPETWMSRNFLFDNRFDLNVAQR